MTLLNYIKQPVKEFMERFGPATRVIQEDEVSKTTQTNNSMLEKVFDSGTVSYEKKYKYKETDVPGFVPKEYREAILRGANNYDVDPRKVSALLNTENTPWDPTLKNPLAGSTAIGLGQHTDAYYEQYNPMFKEAFGGREYNRKDPYDSIAATFIGLRDLKSRVGNEDDAIKAYHAGVAGFKGKYKEDAEKYYQKVMSYLKE